MLRHYFKLVRSGLIKNKLYTTINIIGLTCGMLSALIIAKYVGYTFELDNFHLFKNRIFSVNEKEFINGKLQENVGQTYWGVGEQIRQFPEVAAMTRHRQHMEALVTAQSEGAKQSFIENRIFIADSNFLRVFTFPFIYGESKTALSRINAVVLTKSACQKYFGSIIQLDKR
jgi:putative ABC transport system permease protein